MADLIYETKRLSYSSLELYGTCRLQWASRYLLGLEALPTADMLLGRVVHEAIAFGNREWLERGEPPAPGLPQARFLARWYECVEELSVPDTGLELAMDEYWQGEDPKSLSETGSRLVGKYFAEVAASYPPTAVELELARPIEGLCYISAFAGVVDLLSGDLVVEYKVRRQASSPTRLSLALQPLAYAYLLGRPTAAHYVELVRNGDIRVFETGKVQEDLGWFESRYLLPLAREIDRSLHELAQELTGRRCLDASEWREALTEAGEELEGILPNYFPPTPGWSCGGCLYRFGCGYMI